jgi:hypothetical protein
MEAVIRVGKFGPSCAAFGQKARGAPGRDHQTASD